MAPIHPAGRPAPPAASCPAPHRRLRWLVTAPRARPVEHGPCTRALARRKGRRFPRKRRSRQCDKSDQPAHQGPAPTSEHRAAPRESCPVLQLARRSRLPPFARVGPCRRRPLSSLSLSPPLAEGLVRDRVDVPNGGPAAELTWEAGDHSPLEEQSLAEAAELLHPL